MTLKDVMSLGRPAQADPQAIAALKAGRRPTPPKGRAERLLEAQVEAAKLMGAMQAEAMQATDGTEIAARVLNHAAGLIADVSRLFMEDKPTARSESRRLIQDTLRVIWDSMSQAIAVNVADREAALTAAEQALAADRAAFDEERDLLARAADTANAEASAARRDAQAARQNLTDERARHRANATKNAELHAAEVREIRQRLNAAQMENSNLRREVARLQAEVDRLGAEKEMEMQVETVTVTGYEALSLRRWLADAGLNPPRLEGAQMTVEVPAKVLMGWRSACPDAEAQKRHLAAAIRKGGEAA